MADRQPQDESLLGRRFGSYVVEALIGSGGMGSVYRAVQPDIGKHVAIKFLSAHLSAAPELVQRFFAEARSVNLIEHDNIVDIFDFGQSDGLSYFVMELLKGRSLESLLVEERTLSVERTLDLCRQIADAVGAAHQRNIIHRDLKTENIFLVTKGKRLDFVKLLDFGIAKLNDPSAPISRTMQGAVLGTPGYMSPEQGTGGAVDGRTDVYALGVLAYRMLTGRLPFDGESFLKILNRQLTEEPPELRSLRPDVSPSLAALVHRMIAKQPDDRPATMADVLAGLVEPELAPAPREPSARMATPSQARPLWAPEPKTTLSGAAGQATRAEMAAAGLTGRRRGWAFGLGGVIALGVVAVVAWPRSHDMVTKADPQASVAGGKSSVAAGKPTVARSSAGKPTVAKPGLGKSALATNSAVAAAKPAVAKPAEAAKPADGSFAVLIETNPPGAQVVGGGKPLGTTPAKLSLTVDPSLLHLRLAGFRDEELEIGRDTEHAIVRMHALRPDAPAPHATVSHPTVILPGAPHSTAHATAPVAKPAPPPPPKKPSIGLDD